MLSFLQDTIIVTGHYGSGKTNLSISLALALREQGKEVALCDLDIVNPYFRSADFGELTQRHGIDLIVPAYAGSSLDIPALTGELDARLHSGGTLIIDVGGDDAGAFALGRYAPRIEQRDYTMLYVVNRFRYLTRDPREAAQLLTEIETASRLRVTHIVNNSNLAAETTADDVLGSVRFARDVAESTGKQYAFTAAKRDLEPELTGRLDCLYVERHVRTLWDT